MKKNSDIKKTSERQVRLMRKALRNALVVLNLSDPEGRRAKLISAPEDPEVLALCRRIGFGAVMDSAARQWRLLDEREGGGGRGAHTVGACVGSVQVAIALVKKALGAK